MPITKEFSTIDDRIKTLENRKLKFRSKRKAKQLLVKYNYFDVINGFESILLKNTFPKKEYENIFFEDFFDLYKLDTLLKKHVFFMILDIESRLKTSISYHFSQEFCDTVDTTLNYLNRECYKHPDSEDRHLCNVFRKFALFKEEIRDSNGTIRSKSFIDSLKQSHEYINRYEKPPFWVAIKAIPFGTLYYTYLFLNEHIQDSVLSDFNYRKEDNLAYQQGIYILREMRNQCAHLELITRFKLKRAERLNYFNEITAYCALSRDQINFMDVLKILKTFGSINQIKFTIISFYLKMVVKGRHHVATTILGKMGRKSIWAWLFL